MHPGQEKQPYLWLIVSVLGLESQGCEQQARLILTVHPLLQDVSPQLKVILMAGEVVSVETQMRVDTLTFWC